MNLQRAKPAIGPSSAEVKKEKKKAKLPKLDEFLEKRDFTGALTLLEFNRQTGDDSEENAQWIAYCLFHLGEYKKCLEEYKQIVATSPHVSSEIHCNIACCYFMLGMYQESDESADKDVR